MKIVLGTWIERDLRDKLKVYCAVHKITMESVVREAIEERLKNDTTQKSNKRIK